MLKQCTVLFVLLFLVVGCERQQKNTNMVFNKESDKDFTTQPPPKDLPPPPPMLPGKAVVLPAQIPGTDTQVGRATVAPDKNLTKSLENLNNQQ